MADENFDLTDSVPGGVQDFDSGSRYLLCVDGSEGSSMGITRAIMMLKPADTLIALALYTQPDKEADAKAILTKVRTRLLQGGVRINKDNYNLIVFTFYFLDLILFIQPC